MSREQPSTADVRPIEDLITDLQNLLIKKLPTTRKDVLANWGTLCAAVEMYRFSLGIIENNREHDDRFIWIHHGEHTASQRIIRKLADNLGVATMYYELEDKKK